MSAAAAQQQQRLKFCSSAPPDTTTRTSHSHSQSVAVAAGAEGAEGDIERGSFLASHPIPIRRPRERVQVRAACDLLFRGVTSAFPPSFLLLRPLFCSFGLLCLLLFRHQLLMSSVRLARACATTFGCKEGPTNGPAMSLLCLPFLAGIRVRLLVMGSEKGGRGRPSVYDRAMRATK